MALTNPTLCSFQSAYKPRDSAGSVGKSAEPFRRTLRAKPRLNVQISRERRRCVVSIDAKASTANSGRPVVILPGLGNNSSDYDDMVGLLEAQGLPCEVARVARVDWLRNAAGLLQRDYWTGTLQPRPVLDWYLERVLEAVEAAKAKTDAHDQISLVGHSAGGWLARLFMAEFSPRHVSTFVSLGSPHRPPPPDATGIVDQTRGLLNYIERNCPGAYHAPEVKYVCVSGRYIRGIPLFGSNDDVEAEEEALDARADAAAMPTFGSRNTTSPLSSNSPTLQARIVGQGYKQVCGRSNAWGDGVVPEDSALLDGALNIILNGVYHSPVGSSEQRPWYGSPSVLPSWVTHLHD